MSKVPFDRRLLDAGCEVLMPWPHPSKLAKGRAIRRLCANCANGFPRASTWPAAQ